MRKIIMHIGACVLIVIGSAFLFGIEYAANGLVLNNSTAWKGICVGDDIDLSDTDNPHLCLRCAGSPSGVKAFTVNLSHIKSWANDHGTQFQCVIYRSGKADCTLNGAK